MKNIKNTIAAVLMVAVLMVGATSAKAGMLVSDFAGGNNQNPCQQPADRGGIILSDLTGIIVNAFTGIIVNAAIENNTTNRTQTSACRDGMLMSD